MRNGKLQAIRILSNQSALTECRKARKASSTVATIGLVAKTATIVASVDEALVVVWVPSKRITGTPVRPKLTGSLKLWKSIQRTRVSSRN